jgi:hypothetical protein
MQFYRFVCFKRGALLFNCHAFNQLKQDIKSSFDVK